MDLLPDVAIAEEARDSGSQAIYESITRQPVRYAVMDDYHRAIRDKPTPGAYLNGDTCVRSQLDRLQPAGDLVDGDTVARLSFNITEDHNIALTGGTFPSTRPIDPETTKLLFTPLPRDLPTTDKAC